nr:hypothetical protein [Tanacetum cinerariifolium]
DFQNSPDDEEDTRSNQEYINDLEMEFHERTLLAKSKRLFKNVSKGSVVQRQLNKLNVTNVEENVTLQEIVFLRLQFPHTHHPFKTTLNLNSSALLKKPKLRPTKYFKAKYNKVKAKLALLSSGASTLKSSQVRNQGLVAEAYE